MSLDRDAMYAVFEESPGDLTGYGAMGDHLDELGYPSIAHAFRWMSRRGVWPHKRLQYATGGRPGRKVPKNFRWAWYHLAHWNEKRHEEPVRGTVPGSKIGLHVLPPLVMSAEQKVFPSHQAAVMWLAAALANLKAAYDLDVPTKKGLPSSAEVLSVGATGYLALEKPC